MRLLVRSFLLAIGIACASVNAYDPQAHVQQPYEIATAASASYTSPFIHDDVISTPLPNVAQPTPFAEVPSPGAPPLILSGKLFAESSSDALAMPNETTDIANGAMSRSQGGVYDGSNGLAHALSSVGGAFIAVFTFACLESLLSYVLTGKTPFG